MGKKFEELQLQDDFMFSIVMRKPEYCKPFLEIILGIKIARIEYPESQETIDLSADAKSVRLDVYVEGDETVYDIEMQTTRNENLPKRTRYYQGMIDLNILEKGENYTKLKKSFVIFVCTFDLFGEGRHIYTFENRCVQNPELSLGDDATKIILNTKGTMDDVTPEMKNLLDYIDGQHPKDDFTKKLDEEVITVRGNKNWRLDYMTLQMKFDEKFEEGLEQGLERGLEQGRQKENRQIILNMLKKNFSAETISECTNQSIDYILKLQKELKNTEECMVQEETKYGE
jgi:predicted transposase/invertase (TIGR01784 family)